MRRLLDCGGGLLCYEVPRREVHAAIPDTTTTPPCGGGNSRCILRIGLPPLLRRSVGFGPVASPLGGCHTCIQAGPRPIQLFGSRRLSNSFWCSRSQMSASCQSHANRQQVIPLPQSMSCGSISQGMPVCRTNRTPANAARFEMRGLPSFGYSGSSGGRGSTICRSS